MIDSVIYILLACIEGFSFFFITFGLFRIDMKGYIREIIISVFIVSMGTLFLSFDTFWSKYTPFINLLVLIFLLTVFFKVSIYYSLLIAIVGFALCMTIQWIVLKTAGYFGDMSLIEIKNDLYLRRIFQLGTSLVVTAISAILRKYNLWFTFIPYSTTISFKMSRSNLLILILGVFILIVFGFSLKFSSMIIGFSIWAFSLALFLLVSIRKEFNKS